MKAEPVPDLPILMVDDEEAFLQSLSVTLKRLGGYSHIIECRDSREVMEILKRQPVSLVLLDLMMPHLSGEELLGRIAGEYPEIPAIILTGMNQVELAVKCMKLGAFDFFVKTGEAERLVAGIGRALAKRELQQECDRLKSRVLDEQLEHPEAFAGIVTASSKMHAIFKYIEAVSGTREPVLITGDSGVGKELFARAVHQLTRPEGPWVAVNVAGLDDNIFSDTLFGHTRGAFTGATEVRPGMIEQARFGTLFLDEIGDLTMESQVKLLRLLQEGEYFPLGSDKPKRATARVVVATNQDLRKLQAEGRFRKDLYFRLRAHHVHIPPLRERAEDIPLLLDFFLSDVARQLSKKKPTPPAELPVLLSLHPFPGNVRELRAMVFDAVSTHKTKKLSMESFKKAMGLSGEKAPADRDLLRESLLLTFHERLPTLKEGADLLVREAMRRTKGNQSMAARLLGITQPSLSSRLKKLQKKSSP